MYANYYIRYFMNYETKTRQTFPFLSLSVDTSLLDFLLQLHIIS